MSPGPGGADFAVDLSNCDREPIHVPGAIQPHGVLLVLRARDLAIVQASANCDALLGEPAEALLGSSVARVIGDAAAIALGGALAAGSPAAVNPLAVRTGGAGGRAWAAIVHASEAGLILELEPAAEAEDPRSVSGLFGRVRRGLARLQSTRTLADLFEAMAEEIHALTGLDRAMVYRFDESWNGEVVAEARSPGVEGFMGLRFPASDIPAQARELYRRNWLRMIVDSSYTPAALVPPRDPETGAALDLSGAALRSVSPIHLEYLRNMGVAASMSVSLLRAGELWGLVACHHRTPRYLPYEVRVACEFLGQTFSVQLGTLADEADRDYALALAARRGELLNRTARSDDWAHALVDGEPSLAALVEAGGAAVWAGGKVHRVGAAPPDDVIAALVQWLAARGSEVFETDRLPGLFPPAAAHASVASGLLAVAIGRARGDYLLWFRPEAVRTVAWAGNPAKPVRVERAGTGAASTGAAAATPTHAAAAGPAPTVPRLHPRRSFDAWSETVRAQSLPWRAAERQAARAIRDHIVEIVLRQADAMARLNDELRRSNDELEAFTYIVSHDLKEPLRGIHTLSEIVLADQGERIDAEGRTQVETLMRLSRRMDDMLDSLLEHSRAGQLELRRVPTDMQQLLDDVLDSLQTRVQDTGAVIRVAAPLPTIDCDPVRAGAVLQNLIANALKYNDKPRPEIEIGVETVNGVPVFHVRDNGIGIPRARYDEVFRLFRRLHGRTQYGGGTGAGLTIARRLVERHGGRIWLESTPGVSTTFFFTLEPS